MTRTKSAILAGAAVLALAGSAYAAAGAPALHSITVKTPDGGVATIRYSGNVAPKVTFGAAPARNAMFAPANPFAYADRISAAMDHEMSMLLRQADILALPFANPLYNATLRDVPANHAHAWFAGLGNHGFCMRSVQITSTGHGKPHVVSHSAGDCGGAAGLHGTTAQVVPRNGHGMLQAVGKAPAQKKLPMFYETGYRPH